MQIFYKYTTYFYVNQYFLIGNFSLFLIIVIYIWQYFFFQNNIDCEGNLFYISTNITSSPIHLIFCHWITISLLEDIMLKKRLLPGTIMEVIVPVSKSAHTSCTKPKSFSVFYINNFFMFKIHSLLSHASSLYIILFYYMLLFFLLILFYWFYYFLLLYEIILKNCLFIL